MAEPTMTNSLKASDVKHPNYNPWLRTVIQSTLWQRQSRIDEHMLNDAKLLSRLRLITKVGQFPCNGIWMLCLQTRQLSSHKTSYGKEWKTDGEQKVIFRCLNTLVATFLATNKKEWQWNSFFLYFFCSNIQKLCVSHSLPALYFFVCVMWSASTSVAGAW